MTNNERVVYYANMALCDVGYVNNPIWYTDADGFTSLRIDCPDLLSIKAIAFAMAKVWGNSYRMVCWEHAKPYLWSKCDRIPVLEAICNPLRKCLA